MLEDRHSNHGFTLVELAVTILVLGLILAFSIPTFRSISNSQQLKGTVENMAAQIRMAREKAIATGQQQTFHFFENSYDADYHIHNGSYIPAKWAFPNGITYYWGAGTVSVYVLHSDGRVYDTSGFPLSGMLILQDMRSRLDTVSVQASGLVLTK